VGEIPVIAVPQGCSKRQLDNSIRAEAAKGAGLAARVPFVEHFHGFVPRLTAARVFCCGVKGPLSGLGGGLSATGGTSTRDRPGAEVLERFPVRPDRLGGGQWAARRPRKGIGLFQGLACRIILLAGLNGGPWP